MNFIFNMHCSTGKEIILTGLANLSRTQWVCHCSFRLHRPNLSAGVECTSRQGSQSLTFCCSLDGPSFIFPCLLGCQCLAVQPLSGTMGLLVSVPSSHQQSHGGYLETPLCSFSHAFSHLLLPSAHRLLWHLIGTTRFWRWA